MIPVDENVLVGAVDKVSRSVVNIASVRMMHDHMFRVFPVEGVGSGVVIDEQGYILTNNHVIDDAERLKVTFADGRIVLKSDTSRGESYADILRRNGMESIEATVDSKPGDENKKYSMHAFCAHFLELRVDVELGILRVTRIVSACGAGRIVNEKTAISQLSGGIVGGLGMALMEETVMDHRMGRYVNANFGEYHVPVNADVPSIETFFVEEHDDKVNPLGAKGIGEVSYVGVAAAVANAVFHATGKRIRRLPITLDKLL